MGKRPRETFFQRRYTNGQHVHKKVSIINRDCKLKPQYKSNHYTVHFICVLIVYQLFIDKTGKIGTRIWIDISSSKICKFPMSTWKKRTASLATMECKLKPQWDTPSHLLRWLYSDRVKLVWWECGKTKSLLHCWRLSGKAALGTSPAFPQMAKYFYLVIQQCYS